MCLITFKWQPDHNTPLVLAANRDEFHHRPSLASHYWSDFPEMFAGKDLTGGGTWMGVSTKGRFAALTNVRQIPQPYEGSVTRGRLVADYLQSDISAESYLENISLNPKRHDGFNLIVGDRHHCWYYSNRSENGPQLLKPGIYGVSNHLLNTPWPKVLFATHALEQWLLSNHLDETQQLDSLSDLLSRKLIYPDKLLPITGAEVSWERLLSAPRIISPNYGTRACTGLILTQEAFYWQENLLNPEGNAIESIKKVGSIST